MTTNENRDEAENRGHRRPWHGFHRRENFHRIQLGQRGFLRPQIIQLLEREPMNGVDIMNELQNRSRGWYRPSPGSIYPLLEQLENEGLIAKNKDGKFELTAEYGKRSGVGDEVRNIISDMESNTSYLEDLLRINGKGLSDYAERVENLTKRLMSLNNKLQSGKVQQ